MSITVLSAQTQLVDPETLAATSIFWQFITSFNASGVPITQLPIVDKAGIATPIFRKVLESLSNAATVPRASVPLVDPKTGKPTRVFQLYLQSIAA